MPDRDYYLKEEPVYNGAARQVRRAHRAAVEARRRRRRGAGSAVHRGARDADRHGALAARQAPRARPHLQPAHARGFDRCSLRACHGRRCSPGPGSRSSRASWCASSDAVQALSALFAQVPLRALAVYLRYHYLAGNADVLPQAFDDEVFDFYGRALHGTQEQQPRWKRAVAAVNDGLGRGGGRVVRAALLSGLLEAPDAGAGREPARLLPRAHRASCPG